MGAWRVARSARQREGRSREAREGEIAGGTVEPYVTVESLGSKTQAWLDRIHPYNQHEMRLNRAASALLVVDMQRFFLDAASPTFTCGGEAILPTVQRLLDAFRGARRPVIFTRHVHHPDGLDSGIMGWWWEGKCLEGSLESEIHPGLAPRPGEKVICKHRYSAFYNTDLETVLRCLKVEDVVIAGVMTNMCFDGAGRILPRLPRVRPGGRHGIHQRGDAPGESLESRVRVCVRDDRGQDCGPVGARKPSRGNRLGHIQTPYGGQRPSGTAFVGRCEP
jgi:hypothetical protein